MRICSFFVLWTEGYKKTQSKQWPWTSYLCTMTIVKLHILAQPHTRCILLDFVCIISYRPIYLFFLKYYLHILCLRNVLGNLLISYLIGRIDYATLTFLKSWSVLNFVSFEISYAFLPCVAFLLSFLVHTLFATVITVVHRA